MQVYKVTQAFERGDFRGCLPFTWKIQKFQLENQMVHIIPFEVILKL